MFCSLKWPYDIKQQTNVVREILPNSASFKGEILTDICVLSNNVVLLFSWNQVYIHPAELFIGTKPQDKIQRHNKWKEKIFPIAKKISSSDKMHKVLLSSLHKKENFFLTFSHVTHIPL